MTTLIWRMLKKSKGVQMAVVLLLASGVAVLSIYASYMEREAKDMDQRIKNGTPPGYFLVEETKLMRNKQLPSASPFGGYFCLLASWYHAPTLTNLGNMNITYVDVNNVDLKMTLATKGAAVHSELAQRLGLSLGDILTLSRPGGPLIVDVVDIFEARPFDQDFDFGESIVVNTGEEQSNKYFLYAKGAVQRSDEQTLMAISRRHTRNSTIAPAHELGLMGKLMVQSNYAVISQAKLTLLFFLCLAFLTAKLLGYLDNRRMLAILKSLGLTQRQTAAAISVESLVAPLCGAIAGGALSVALIHVLSRTGYSMNASLHIVLPAMLSIFPAVFLGIFVPARLAQVSTVNELLFERPAAMFREQTNSLRNRHPALDAMVKQGVQFLCFQKADGRFDGFIFRKLGDKVQKGEVLAIQYSWWGMKTNEYVAPVTGRVVYYESYTGMVGIGPEDMLLSE